MSQPPSSPATSTAVGALVIPTPTWVASGSHERKRQCRLVEGWTAVSALELGIQSYLNSNPNQIDNLPYPVMAQYDSQRSLLGYLRHNFATRPRPRKSPAPGAPTKPGDSQRPGDGPGPKPSPAAPRRSPWSREQTPDNPFDLIAEFVPHFSDTGLCLRWAGIPSHQSCTLIFQKTCFDAASAQAAGERMADQAEALGDRFLRSAHNPLLRLRPDGLRALFPWNTGWVGEFEFRSPERPGLGCDRCDQKLGHCPPPVAQILRVLWELDLCGGIDFLVTPGFTLDSDVVRRWSIGYQLQARITAQTRPTPELLGRIARRTRLFPMEGNPVLREHFFSPGTPELWARIAVGAPLGPPLEGLVSRPMTVKGVVDCLPWARRSSWTWWRGQRAASSWR